MGVLDAPLRNLVSNILRTFGTSVKVKYTETGEYDTATGDSTDAEWTTELKGAITSYTSYYVETGQVQAGDRRLMVAAKDTTFEPKPGAVVTIGEKEYRVIHVDATQATDQVAMFTLQIRGV